MANGKVSLGGEGLRPCIATRTGTSDLNNSENKMKYSEKLLHRFQKTYAERFGEHITLEVADAELNKLARFVEAVYPDPK